MGLRQHYFTRRLIDAILREDLFGTVSTARLVSDSDGTWLESSPRPDVHWRIPVEACPHVQPWVAAQDYIEEEQAGRRRFLTRPHELFAGFQIDEREALEQELACALEHDDLAQSARAQLGSESASPPKHWHEWLRHYDQLAAFLDHPYYPTARAKVGLDETELRRYAPEWSPELSLRWLGVPPERITNRQGELPSYWPTTQELGLPSGLVPVPVHPHTAERLTDLEGLIWSEERAWPVTPTLSVRTLALLDHPEQHIKLPLFMRSLSFKNLRKVKPDTLYDGHEVQTMLSEIVSSHSELRDRVLLTDESAGLAVDGRADLGFILRRYPEERLQGCRVLPVAALNALTPAGNTVIDTLGDEFLYRYIDTTLQVHLALWCDYGIALESNQQNSLVVIDPQGEVRLLLKDNDAARIYGKFTNTRGVMVPTFKDPCLTVDDWLPIAQMFITITLQLNLLPFLTSSQALEYTARGCRELLASRPRHNRAQELLLEAPLHPVKRLFSAGTLFSKGSTGAADINKYYGLTGPNSLRTALGTEVGAGAAR